MMTRLPHHYIISRLIWVSQSSSQVPRPFLSALSFRYALLTIICMTDEPDRPAAFVRYPVEVHVKGKYQSCEGNQWRICQNNRVKKNQKVTMCNQLDLDTL